MPVQLRVIQCETAKDDETKERLAVIEEQRVAEADEIAREHNMRLLYANAYRAAMTDGTCIVRIQFDGYAFVQVETLLASDKKPLTEKSASAVARELISEVREAQSSYTYEMTSETGQ